MDISYKLQMSTVIRLFEILPTNAAHILQIATMYKCYLVVQLINSLT